MLESSTPDGSKLQTYEARLSAEEGIGLDQLDLKIEAEKVREVELQRW